MCCGVCVCVCVCVCEREKERERKTVSSYIYKLKKLLPLTIEVPDHVYVLG